MLKLLLVQEVSELKMLLQNEMQTRKAAEEEIYKLKDQLHMLTKPGVCFSLIIHFSNRIS